MPVPGLIIVGCSRRKKPHPAPALDLYEGWCVPRLREAIAPCHRKRVLVLSARHGLIPADRWSAPYDQAMTPQRARRLRPCTSAFLADHRRRFPVSEALLLLSEPYLAALDPAETAPLVHIVDDPVGHWAQAERILRTWRWTP